MCLEEIAQIVESRLQRLNERSLGPLARRRIGKRGQVRRHALRRVGTGIGSSAGQLIKRVDCEIDAGDLVGPRLLVEAGFRAGSSVLAAFSISGSFCC